MVSNREHATAAEIELYQQIVGSLIYLSTQTRPDLCYSMSVLSRYLTNPSSDHMNAAKHALRYLRGTPNIGITYGDGEGVYDP
jgi:hypothetical protein